MVLSYKNIYACVVLNIFINEASMLDTKLGTVFAKIQFGIS